MKRIHYIEQSSGDDSPPILVSSTVFETDNGQVLVYLLGDVAFQIKDATTGELISTGESKAGSSTYLKRAAKASLQKLMKPGSFEKEVRQKRLQD